MLCFLKTLSLSLFITPFFSPATPLIENLYKTNTSAVPTFYNPEYFVVSNNTLTGLKYYEGSENANTLLVNSSSLNIHAISSLLPGSLPPTIHNLMINNDSDTTFTLENKAFYNTNVHVVDLSGNNFSIGDSAFELCVNLTKIMDNAPISHLGTSSLSIGNKLEFEIYNQTTANNTILWFPKIYLTSTFSYPFLCNKAGTSEIQENCLTMTYDRIISQALHSPILCGNYIKMTNLVISSCAEIFLPDTLQKNIDDTPQIFTSEDVILTVNERRWMQASVNGYGNKKTIYENFVTTYTNIKYNTISLNGDMVYYDYYSYKSSIQESNNTATANDFGSSVKFSTGESVKWKNGHYNWFWPASWIDGCMENCGPGYW